MIGRQKRRRGNGHTIGERSRAFTLVELLVANTILVVGVLGIIGMSIEAMKQNSRAYNNNLGVVAIQDRVEQLQGVARTTLQAQGINTAFACSGGNDLIAVGEINEDLSNPGGTLAPGTVTYPFTLKMTFEGVCSPERQNQQTSGLRINPLRANIYQVSFELTHIGDQTIRYGRALISDCPTC